jgi:hypothetical protein
MAGHGLGVEHMRRRAHCPTCAAKWRHANAVSPTFLAHAVEEAEGPELEAVLAGSRVQLKFVQFHFDDLKTIISSACNTVAASVASAPIRWGGIRRHLIWRLELATGFKRFRLKLHDKRAALTDLS